MESLDLYGGKKACCKSCGDGHSCESKNGYSAKKNRLLAAMLDPKSDTDIQFPNGYTIPKSIGINKFNSMTLSANGVGSLWIQFNLGQYLLDTYNGVDPLTSIYFEGDATVQARSNLFYSTQASTHAGIDKIVYTQYKGSNICLVKNYFNTIRPGPIKVRIDYVGRSDAAAGNVYIGLSHSFAVVTETNNSGRSTANGLIADTEYSTLKSIEDCPISHVGSAVNSYEIFYIPHDLKTTDFADPKKGLDGITQRINILYTGCDLNAKICLITISANYEAIPNTDFSEVVRGGNCKASTKSDFEEAVEVIQKGGIIRQVPNPYGIEGLLSNINK